MLERVVRHIKMKRRSKDMLMIRDFSNRFQQISGMPINQQAGRISKRLALTRHKQTVSAYEKVCRRVLWCWVKQMFRQSKTMSPRKDGDYINPYGIGGSGCKGEKTVRKNRIN